MVSEIIPAILGPLPLSRHPKSKPFTPCAVVRPVYPIVEPAPSAHLEDDLAADVTGLHPGVGIRGAFEG